MIDPKQENTVTDFNSEHISVLQDKLTAANAEIIKYHRMINDAEYDHQVMLHMLQHFVTIFVERQNEDIIKDALEYAYDATGLDYETIAEIVERLAICDPDLCKRDYIVTVTVPVTVTLSLAASSASEAEEMAQNEIEMNGLDDYDMEYDIYHNADYDTEMEG